MSTIEERYQKLSHREHILHRPETYIGSITTEPKEMYVVERVGDFNDIKIKKETVDYNAGFIKIFDEIITNASDHYIRTGEVKYIKVEVKSDYISVENDGPGIPVEMHKTEKVYVPELIFGHLLTGENYDDSEDRMVGGRNGYGAKLTNCFSKKFILETCDGIKNYSQIFSDNLSKIEKPKITKKKKKYTKITYYPDFKKFGLTKINNHLGRILFKRVLDVATYCSALKIYWNGELIPIKNFKNYIDLYNTGDTKNIIYEKVNDNWEFGLLRSTTDNFEQISMVNGISTLEGGTHVNYLSNQVIKGITEYLTKKHKNVTVKPNDIKRNLFVFVNCKIANPEFSTQTKESLTTRLYQKHTQNAEISDKVIKNICTSDILENILRYIEAKEAASIKSAMNKRSSKVKIAKLNDAIKAGSDESKKCMLFLTEGDSAKTSALTGFSVTGREYFGAFSLKGKPLNVRDVSLKKIQDNKEIMEIIEALGLKFGKKYKSVNELRYGKVVIMSDQDLDGFHIKGLLINLFDFFWPELLKLDFLYEFITPIVRVSKAKDVKYFYRLDEYKTWKSKNSGYSIKYYKGLGTIEKHECKEFFRNIKKHLIRFNYRDEEKTKDAIELAFKDKRSNDRKTWLSNYTPGVEIDKFKDKTYIDSFIHNELIEFSMYDNIRSIPSYIDGLKPSHRKVLYTMFKKKPTKNIKVIQLCGSVLENAAYHHGDASLQQNIVGMAQDFVGSNNVNLLDPLGQFGSRLSGGKDAAAARYIETKLTDKTRKIFKLEDDNLLNYLDDDGYSIEPDFYVPIIPMLLVNGSVGVGTGYSTNIPQFNPNQIVDYYKTRLKGEDYTEKIIPYYKDFKGEITWDNKKGRYLSRGVYEFSGQTNILIKELPIGTWTEKYIDSLDKLCDDKVIKDYENNCSDTGIDIKIIITKENYKELKKANIYSKLNLESFISINNMLAFDEFGKLIKFNNQYDILDRFYNLRLKYYKKRKEYLLAKHQEDRRILLNKIKFIKGILDNKIVMKNKKRDVIENMLEKLGIERNGSGSYDYLLNMSFISLSNEKLIELKGAYEHKKKIILALDKTSEKALWFKDLNDVGEL